MGPFLIGLIISQIINHTGLLNGGEKGKFLAFVAVSCAASEKNLERRLKSVTLQKKVSKIISSLITEAPDQTRPSQPRSSLLKGAVIFIYLFLALHKV